MSSISCIIQARRQSERLPNKILKLLAGKPILAHVIERCQQIHGVTSVVVAAPTGNYEDPVEDAAREAGALCFRGSMHDVLDRYVGAASLVDARFIMRVTADCPLIDPGLCSELTKRFLEQSGDYGGLSGWPHGLDCEIFTRELLMEAHSMATSAEDREHVTLWMKRQQHFKSVIHKPENGSYHSGNRWVVDYPEDYAFLSELFDRLALHTARIPWREVLAFIDKNPELREINALCEQDWVRRTKAIYASTGRSWNPE